ncbi:MAG: lipopolysaccharide heptosyltransferase I [Betaproteobacteria bacterium]|nr:lipopolysaccharide heptosyltransferase I [Betaproteobacteria bacterium]
MQATRPNFIGTASHPALVMLNILLVKTSSMGDLVHNCPVVTDILAHYPDAGIDWVAEEAYVPIPSLHPGVRRVIPIAWRRWRKHLLEGATWREMGEFRRQLQESAYDFVLDTQGLLKSVAVARLARLAPGGVIVGGDRESIKEPLTARFYDRRLPIGWSRHVVDRCRAVAAGALGYSLDAPPRYNISAAPLEASWLPQDTSYAVLMHAASRPPKLWPEADWIAVGQQLAVHGIRAVFPWGSAEEKQRSERLAQALPGSVVPPLMDLSVAARFLAGARVVVGLDTGFTHFAAALGRPTIGIFCDSDGEQAAVFGDAYCASFGKKGAPPDRPTILAALEQALVSPL